jgi:CubicO group peptidase (beta-lactamase class C family)
MGGKRVPFGRWLPALLLAVWATSAGAEPLVDPHELEQWADDYYGRAVAERRSPGITVSVVQDGEVIFAKGYGYADYAQRIPVDPERSGFIVGSITKTFIATALGQLIDRGLIASFDDPVNRYLKRVQLPGARGARVTIRQVLTHRAGFEDVNFGQGDPAGLGVALPLPASEIERFMPELALEPGGPSVYSNWGFSLLGFLIEDVSGQRIDTYLKENIWKPLGMAHTSMVYGSFPANLSRAYWFDEQGQPIAQPLGLPHPWIGPAGTIVSTAGDMARYMNAHIFEGEDGHPALVSRETFRELHTENARNAPISHGFALPFFTGTLNGAPTIEHGGGAPGFQSMMLMIPQKRFGFFVSAMQGGPAPWAGDPADGSNATGVIVRDPPLGFALRESFVERFLQVPTEPARSRQVDPKKLVGTYWNARRSFTTIEILKEAFDPAAVLTVKLAPDGQGLLLNGSGPYRAAGDGVFISPTGRNVWKDSYSLDLFVPAQIAFNLDATGNGTSLVPGMADQVWERASPVFNPLVMRLGLLLGGLVVLSGLLLFAWPQRRRFASPSNWLALALACGVLVFPLALAAGFSGHDNLIEYMIRGDKGRFVATIVTANAMVLLTVAFLLAALREPSPVGLEGPAGWVRQGRRVHLAAVAVAALVVLVALGFFNFLGWHLPD